MSSTRVVLAVLAASSVAGAVEPKDCVAERKRAVALRETLASVGDASSEYRAMMVRKIQDAEAAAANCERAATEQRRIATEQAASKKREEENAAKKRAEDQFAIDELRSQPSFLRLAWSAYECRAEKDQETIAGNPFATEEQKQNLKRIGILLERIRSVMKRGKLQQQPCRSDTVAKLAFCLADSNANAACTEAEMARMLAAEQEIVANMQIVPSEAPLAPSQRSPDGDVDMKLMAPKF